jgi:hypothetical protein
MITSIKKITTMPAYNILECDGENLQAHIAASMSQDPALCELFLKGGDFHSNNAYSIMAKYQLFIPYEVTFTDGSVMEVMEWKSFDTERGKHISISKLQPGDKIFGKVFASSRQLAARKISYEEYVRDAKEGRLKELRTTAKFCGFGFLFGMAALTFSTNTLRMEWTAEKCEQFIPEYNLEKLRDSLRKRYKNLSEDDLAYLTVATFFRDEFFKMYPVLEKWILQQGAIAAKQGYVRSPWGARRLLPQLTYQGRHSDSKEIKNLSNIAVNSPVQNYEAVYMAKAMVGTAKDMEANGFHSYIAGTVHDSIVPFTFVEEQDEVLKIMLTYFATDYPAAKGIPYAGECNVAEVAKGFIWGYGEREVKLKEVKDVVIRPRNYFA